MVFFNLAAIFRKYGREDWLGPGNTAPVSKVPVRGQEGEGGHKKIHQNKNASIESQKTQKHDKVSYFSSSDYISGY